MTSEDDDIVQHMIDNQVDPQLRAADARDRGLNVTTTFVSTAPDAPGFLLECVRCHRTARMPTEPPADLVPICPACARAVDL